MGKSCDIKKKETDNHVHVDSYMSYAIKNKNKKKRERHHKHVENCHVNL